MEREHKSTVAELFDPLTPLSMAVVGAAAVVLLAIGVALLGGMPGCADTNKVAGAAQSGSVKAASGEIGKAASLIDKEADAIAKEAPQEKPHTDAIGEQTDALRVTQGKLDAAQETIRANEKDCAAKDDTIKKLEDEKKNGMRQRLIQLVATGLLVFAVGVGLSVFLSAKIGGPFIAGGVALAIGAVEFQTVLDHALWITLGTLGIGAAFLLIHGAAFRQVVGFAEQIKPVTEPQVIAKIGEQTQSWFTRVFVGWARKRLA